jgi:hypothetical protein
LHLCIAFSFAILFHVRHDDRVTIIIFDSVFNCLSVRTWEKLKNYSRIVFKTHTYLRIFFWEAFCDLNEPFLHLKCHVKYSQKHFASSVSVWGGRWCHMQIFPSVIQNWNSRKIFCWFDDSGGHQTSRKYSSLSSPFREQYEYVRSSISAHQYAAASA